MKKYAYLFCLSVILMLQACSSSNEWHVYEFENVPIKEIVPYANNNEIKVFGNGTKGTVNGFKFVLEKPVNCSGLEVTEIFLNSKYINAGPWLREYIIVMANPNTRYKFQELSIESNGKQIFLRHHVSSIDKL